MKASEFLNVVTEVGEKLIEYQKKALELAEDLEDLTEFLCDALCELKETLDKLERKYKNKRKELN